MGMDETAVQKRLDAQRGDTDDVIILKNLRKMKAHFGIVDQISVQYAIIDALYKNNQGERSSERKKFEDQCEKLYNCISEKLEKTPAMVEAMVVAYNKIETCKWLLALFMFLHDSSNYEMCSVNVPPIIYH